MTAVITPLVSIGIPVYNGSNYIIETLESIKAQTYRNIEIFIVDDASTDTSVSVVKKWMSENSDLAVTLLERSENKGPCEACNTFFENCNGEFFQYVGCDDLLFPDKISKQIALLTELGDEYAFVYTDTDLINAKGAQQHTSYLESLNYNKHLMPQGEIFDELLLFNFIQSCTPLVRTEAARAVGGFNTRFWMEDYDLWLRLAYNYKVAYIPEVTASYRIHSSSLTNTSKTWARTIDEALHMRFQYIRNVNPATRKKIVEIIKHDAAALYSFEYDTAEYWLSKSFAISPHLKGAILLTFCKSGIRFKAISALKSKIL